MSNSQTQDLQVKISKSLPLSKLKALISGPVYLIMCSAPEALKQLLSQTKSIPGLVYWIYRDQEDYVLWIQVCYF